LAFREVLTLASDLAKGQAEAIPLEHYYDDAMTTMSQRPLFTQAEIVVVTKGTAVYTRPASAGQLMGMLYDDDWLPRLSINELNYLDRSWRDRIGRPLGYVLEEENANDIRLYPIPDISSTALSFVSGEPLGVDYPRYALVFVFGERRDNLPVWMDFPLALGILQREFTRESNHRDPRFADACGALSDLFLGLML